MTPRTKAIIALIALLLLLWAFTLWIIWQPYTYGQEPTIAREYKSFRIQGH